MGNSQNTPLRMTLRARLGGPGGLSAGVIFGLMLITGGTVLFIDNLGVFPISLADAFWPIVLLVFSAIGVTLTKSLAVKIWSVTGMVAAVLLILGEFHVIHATSDIVWPLILIATGVVMLVYRMRWRAFADGVNIGTSSKGRIAENKLQEAAVFSAVKRRVEAPDFAGGELNSVFGSIEVDLRWAGVTTPDRTIVIEANAVFGGVEIRIPETWKLNLLGTAVFGTYEDKTIPPRPEPGVVLPTLVIRGGAAFGSVIIRN
jgi:predicted membrane protein